MTNIVGTKVTIVAGSDIFRIAGQSTADEYQWHGRLLNEIAISEAFQVVGNTPSTQSINIDNHDSFIAANIELWGATVVIETDSGKSWHGKINAYDYDGSGVLRISATERAAPEYEIQIPDEVMRLGDVDQNLHVSFANSTLPTVIGGNTTTPILIQGILAHKEDGVYLLCVGEIHQIVKVYRGTEEITTGFTAYVGAPRQVNYAGAAYVQITDEDLRVNDDGTYAKIRAEVVGLKLGNHTIEECRNGARFLYHLLTTAAAGEGGWGIGVDPTEIDTDSFNSAIASVDVASLKLDGVMYFRQKAQSWIDQICQSIRGSYKIGADGKRSLWVNSNRVSVKTFGREIQVERYGKGTFTGRVYNKGKLDYGYNPITGQFMQSAQYEDTVSIASIGEHEFYGQSHLIADAATAQKILEYNCKKSLVGASKVYFSVAELEASIKIGDVITIDRADLNLFGIFQITSLNTTDFISTIEAEKFSSDIFTSGTPNTKIEWGDDADIASTISPGIASGLTLSSEVRQTQDGTNIVVLKGTFTLPNGRYTAATIEYGRVISPATDPDPWLNMGMIQGDSFEIAPILPATIYKVRIRMITSTAHSDYITGTITTQGDTVAPGIPTIGADSNLKIVTIRCVLSQAPSDMAGFKFYRSTANNSDNAVYIGSQASKDGSAVFVDNAPDYRQFYYFVRSFDTWGNMSAFSASVAITTYGVSSADIIADAIKVPLGSILRLTADGCTTASIAEVDGVIDASGNANHGRAYGGVTVVDAVELGKCFNFDGENDYLDISGDRLIESNQSITWSITMKMPSPFDVREQHIIDSYEPRGLLYKRANQTTLTFFNGAYFDLLIPISAGEVLTVTLVFDGATCKAYKNAVLTTTFNTHSPSGLQRTICCRHTKTSYFFQGLVSSPTIYGYALTETQVRSLYQCPQQIVTGTITGDRVGANTIVARNLVKTEALITESAQIGNLIVTDAHIQNLSGNKITANSILLGSLNPTLKDYLVASGLGMKVNYSAFNAPNPGELYIHGFDAAGAPADINGWVIWNGAKFIIPKGMVNPGTICPFRTTIYLVVHAIDSAKFLVWYDNTTSTWKDTVGWAPSGVPGSFNPADNNSNRIWLGSFVSPSSEGALVNCELYQRPKANGDIIDSLSYINIGATNLLLRSSLLSDSGLFEVNQNITLTNPGNSYTRVVSNQSNSTPGIIINPAGGWLKVGQTYAVSFDARSVNGLRAIYSALGNTSKGFSPTSEFERFSAILSITTSANPYFLIHMSGMTVGQGFDIRNVKIERGNKATDWSPAPGDTDSVLREWSYNNNTTYIDGGNIYTGTVEADAVAANAITSAKLATDSIKSRNYIPPTSGNFSDVGTFFDLANGSIKSKNFGITATGDACFKGDISGASGSFTGKLVSAENTWNPGLEAFRATTGSFYIYISKYTSSIRHYSDTRVIRLKIALLGCSITMKGLLQISGWGGWVANNRNSFSLEVEGFLPGTLTISFITVGSDAYIKIYSSNWSHYSTNSRAIIASLKLVEMSYAHPTSIATTSPGSETVAKSFTLTAGRATSPSIIETWSSGTSWYRTWTDGWIEQGGYTSFSRDWTNFSLVRPFAGSNYNVQITPSPNSDANYISTVCGARPYSSSLFKAYLLGATVWNRYYCAWRACGF